MSKDAPTPATDTADRLRADLLRVTNTMLRLAVDNHQRDAYEISRVRRNDKSSVLLGGNVFRSTQSSVQTFEITVTGGPTIGPSYMRQCLTSHGTALSTSGRNVDVLARQPSFTEPAMARIMGDDPPWRARPAYAGEWAAAIHDYMNWLADDLLNEAKRNNWCAQYDQIVDQLNAGLSIAWFKKLPPKIETREFTVRVIVPTGTSYDCDSVKAAVQDHMEDTLLSTDFTVQVYGR